MKTLLYRIHLLEPALVTALDGDPNSAVAFGYLPGSVLRGVLIERFLRRERQTELNAADPVTRRFFFNATTRYLNGYIVADNRRMLPIPRSFHVEKRTESPLLDFAIAAGADDKTWKAQAGFARIDGTSIVSVAPKVTITVHTTRDRRAGKPLGGANGTVYQYESLAADQTFEAAILCDEDGDADWFAELLTTMPEGWIGGARSAGYGRVRFEVVDVIEGAWREANTPYPTAGKLILTLLSDAIVRDANGCYAADLQSARAAIAQRLGVSPESLGDGESYLATTQIGGFNRKWGLPLPQTPALAMGSVLIFDHPGCDTDALWALEREGIGERRVEGFGRVAIHYAEHQTYTPLKASEAKLDTVPELPPMVSGRLVAQQMERRIAARANESSLKITNPPRPSQINIVRLAIAEDGRDIQVRYNAFIDALASIDVRQVSRMQFQKARIDRKTLAQWLTTMIEAMNSDDWYNKIGVEPKPAFASDNPDVEFRVTYTFRLIDGVLARAAKDAKKDDA